MITPPLTDRDIMMNLWLGLTMIIDEIGLDPADVQHSLCRDGAPGLPEEGTTMAEIIAETERRLGIANCKLTSETGYLS